MRDMTLYIRDDSPFNQNNGLCVVEARLQFIQKKKGNDGCVVAASSFFDGVVPPMLPFALDHVICVECCRVLQRVAACCSVLQRVAECFRRLHSVAECCRVLQCVQPILPFALDHAICGMTRSSV